MVTKLPIKKLRALYRRYQQVRDLHRWYQVPQLPDLEEAAEQVAAEIERRRRPRVDKKLERQWQLVTTPAPSQYWYCMICHNSYWKIWQAVPPAADGSRPEPVPSMCAHAMIVRRRKPGVKPRLYSMCEECLRNTGLVW